MPADEFEQKLVHKIRFEVKEKRKTVEKDLHIEVTQTKA